jgi:LemA protein
MNTYINNNIAIEIFPDVVIARVFKFKPFKLLQFEVHEKSDVDVRLYFNPERSRGLR